MNTSQNKSAQNSEQTNPKTINDLHQSFAGQAEDESIDTIKFTHAVDGVIEFNSGHTVFGDLLMIGAFASTKGHNHNSEHLWSEYPTDMDGLKLLEAKSGEIIYELSDAISSLGMTLAYVDREVGGKHLTNCAWLIAGLGELLTQLVRENQEITHSLLVLSKQSNILNFGRAEQAKSKA
ncbi:MAG: hypothetical protein QX197_10055 [Methylococcaceae bacterium]